MTNRLIPGNHTHTDLRPLTWTKQPALLPGNQSYGVALYYTGSVWIAVTKIYIYTSTDPLSMGWTIRYTTPSSSQGLNGFASDGAGNYAVIFNNGSLYAIITATDPEGTWTYNAAPAGMYPKCITYGNGQWIIGTSPSQLIWTASSPTGPWTSIASGLPSGYSIYTVIYAGGYYLIGGGSPVSFGYIATATDVNGPWTINSHVHPYFVYQIAYGDGYYSFTTSNSEVFYSSNPTAQWGLTYVPSHQVMQIISYGNNSWIYGGVIGETNEAIYPAGPFLTIPSVWLNGDGGTTAIGYGNNLWIALGSANGGGNAWATAVPGV